MAGIIVGVDGSENAQPALNWAISEAAKCKAPLTVITVNEQVASYWTGQPVAFAGDAERMEHARQAAEAAVAKAIAELNEDEQPTVSVQAVNGFSAKTLVEASKDADLLVIGTRGGGGFPHLSLGGVASQVLHHAYCPVVLVPHSR